MATEHQDALSDDQLDLFLRAGKAGATVLPEPLFARIMADAAAEAMLPGSAAIAVAAPAAGIAPRAGILSAILASVGGWPAMAGMASATVAGLYLGFASPDLGGVIGFGSDYTVGDFMPALDLAEGG